MPQAKKTVIVLGSEGCGKTSLLKKLTKSTSVISPVGADSRTVHNVWYSKIISIGGKNLISSL